MRSSILMLVVAGLMASATALARPVAATPADAVIAHLLQQADAWDKAIVAKDAEAIRANMADDFRQIAGTGQVADRDTFVQVVTSDKLVIDPYTVEELETRAYGNVVLVSGRTRMTGKYDGTPFTSHYRFIDVYVLRDGKWKVASVQITPVAG